MISARTKVLLYSLAIASLFHVVIGESLLSSLSMTLCGIVQGVQTFVGILALALFMIGGVMFAIAHFIPTSVDFRKSMQGWSSAMIVAGIVGIIVVIIAQPLVLLFAGFAVPLGAPAIGFAGCSASAAASVTCASMATPAGGHVCVAAAAACPATYTSYAGTTTDCTGATTHCCYK